jgi:hypothetical protein
LNIELNIFYDADEPRMITMVNGKKFYLYNKYTYSFGFQRKTGQRWRCSAGCKAHILISDSGQFQKALGQHTHRPGNYMVTRDGKYLKVA